MKKLLALVTFLAFTASMTCAQDGITKQANGPSMEFELTTLDYGTIEKGSEPVRYFNFTNVGSEPLIIKNAKGSCGCTTPDWPKEPIMPGEKATITVKYDTNRVGAFTKTVTLTTNEEVGTRVLTIKGTVQKPEDEQSVPAVKNGLNKG